MNCENVASHKLEVLEAALFISNIINFTAFRDKSRSKSQNKSGGID